MSYSLNKLNVVSVLDPRVAMKSFRNFAVMKTGSIVNYQSIVADGDDLSQVVFSANPPNPNTIVSRRVMSWFPYEVTLTGTTTNTNLLDGYLGQFGAPRFAPTAQITDVFSATVNDCTITNNVKNLITMMARCNIEDYEYAKTLSTMPCMPDFYANYSDATNPTAFGNAVNPIAPIGNNSYYCTRGGHLIQVMANTPTSATIRFISYEPLFISPFLPTEDDREGFHGVQTLTFNYVCSNLQRVWSNALGATGNPATITNYKVELYQKPQLDFVYVSAGLLQNIPRSLVYDYMPMNDYKTQTEELPAFDPVKTIDEQGKTATSSLITFAAIPRRIYVYARKNVSSLTANDSDGFAAISNISILYDNRQSLFASCIHPEQLYQISQYNGLEMSYPQFRRHSGSIFICDVGRDLSLVNDDEATGLSIQKQFQVTAKVTNLTNTPAIFDLFVVACLDGLLTIEDNRAIAQISIVSKNDILTAKNAQEFAEYVKPRSFYGGSVLKSLGKVAKTVVNQAKKHNLVSKGLDMAGLSGAAKVAKSVGYGLVPGYPDMGGSRVGGAMMPKQKLKARTVKGSGMYDEDYYE